MNMEVENLADDIILESSDAPIGTFEFWDVEMTPEEEVILGMLQPEE